MVLKSVGVLSAGKMSGAMCAFLGLFIGAIMALMSVAGVAIQAQGKGGAPAIPAVFVGVAAVIFFPLIYGFFGFIMGIIYAAIYNMLAAFVGGLELEFERPATPINQP
jgi:hypothetical protein